MPHYVKNFTLKFNARKMYLSRTDMLPFIRPEKPYNPTCCFFDLGSRKRRAKLLKYNYHLPWVPGTIVSPLPLGFLLL